MSGPPAVKGGAATQFAVNVQVPVPLVMVTVATALADVPLTAPTVQTPEATIVGMTPESVVAVTPKVVLNAAVAGAPVKVTTGAIVPVIWEAMLDQAEAMGCGWNIAGWVAGGPGKKLSVACTL